MRSRQAGNIRPSPAFSAKDIPGLSRLRDNQSMRPSGAGL